jgi:hypothetical protein
MPDPREVWGADEREAARAALSAIQRDDPTHLPRYGSIWSGAVFAKLLKEEARRGPFEGPFGELTGQEFEEMDDQQIA